MSIEGNRDRDRRVIWNHQERDKVSVITPDRRIGAAGYNIDAPWVRYLIRLSLILAQSMLRAGIRAFVGKVSMDIDITPEDSPTHGTYIEESTSVSLANAKRFLDDLDEMLQLKHLSIDAAQMSRERRYAKSLIRPVLTPRFVPTCTDELLKGLGGLAFERDVWIQTHVHEARDEAEWVKQERGVEGLEVLKRVSDTASLQHCRD